MTTHLYRLCEKIEKKYAAGHTMLDDEMVGDVQDLADRTEEIRAALDKVTLDNAKDLKRHLEANILQLLRAFQAQTGLAINGVWLEHANYIRLPVPSVTAVKLDVRL